MSNFLSRPRKLFTARSLLALMACGLFAQSAAADRQPGKPTPDYVAVPFSVGHQNKFFIDAKINGKNASLVLDTGAPITCLDASRARSFNLRPFDGSATVPASVVANGQRHRVTIVPSLALPPLKFTNTPAALIDLRDINRQIGATRDLRCDGIIGLDVLIAMHAVVDCRNGAIYFKMNPDAKSPFPRLLREGGWSAIPLHLAENHLVVQGRVNGAMATFVVDTGAPITALDREFCRQHKIVPTRETFRSRGIHFDDRLARVAWIDHLAFGKYDAALTSVAVFDLARLLSSNRSGLLGVHTLQMNLAVIDCEEMMLYLRHPDETDGGNSGRNDGARRRPN